MSTTAAAASAEPRGARAAAGVATLAGGALVALARALALPRSLWEYDENLFAAAVTRFEPLRHHPHPPGYPLLVALGKLFDLVFHDPFRSLVALAVLSSLVGYAALVAAFRRLLPADEAGERRAVLAALLVHLSPVMLVHGTLPLSDTPALMFVSLLLWAVACLLDGGGMLAAAAVGGAAAAAVGCRPQLLVPVLPMLAVALLQRRSWRHALAAAFAFALLSAAWLLPLVSAAGGWSSFADYELQQAARVAANDAGAARAHRAASSIVAHFLLDPWGPRAASLPLVLLAVFGAVRLVRERRAVLPLVALGGVHLVFCFLVMDPADGARYAIPALPLVALGLLRGVELLAARVGRPRLVPAAVGLLLALGALYAAPVLLARRAAPSPPAQALAWAQRWLPAGAWLMVSPELIAHAEQGLRERPWFVLGDQEACLKRPPGAPVFLLAEGGSDRARAAVFRAQDSDAFRRLTRNHYRVVSLTPLPRRPCRAAAVPLAAAFP